MTYLAIVTALIAGGVVVAGKLLRVLRSKD